MPRRIVVVGSANADLVLAIDHRPAAGETVLGADLVTTPGGKGANQAVAAGRLGGDVAFVGCVGADDHGTLLRRSLTEAGVDVTGLRTVPGASGVAIILLTPDGENSIVVSPAANRQVSAELAEEAAERAGDGVVVVQLEIPLETVRHLAARATRARLVVNAAPAAALPPEVLAVCDPLVVNESEAAVLLGAGPAAATDPAAVAVDLLARGPRSVVLTLGAAGSVHAERGPDGAPGPAVHVPARAVTAVDTTGAGDAFVGALAVELAAGATLADAVALATEVAAAAVGRRGAQASYPTRAELAG